MSGSSSPLARARRYTDRRGALMGEVAWGGAFELVAAVVAAVSFLLLGRQLSPARYGAYVGMFGVAGPLGALTWSGIGLAVLQRAKRLREDHSSVARAYLTQTLLQGTGAAIVSIVVATQIISGLSTPEIVLISVSELVFYALCMTSASIIQVVSGFSAAVRVQMTNALLRLTVLVVLYTTGTLSLRNLGLGWVLVFSLNALWLIGYRLPRLGLQLGFAAPRGTHLSTSSQLSLPLFATNLQTNGDKAVLNAYGFDRDAGLYGAAFRVLKLSLMPIRTLSRVAFNRFIEHHEGERGLHLRRAVAWTKIALAVSAVIVVALWFLAPGLTWLVGQKFSESVSIIRWLLFFVPLRALNTAPLTGLLGLNRPGVRAAVVLSSAAIAVVSYLVLIPFLSWHGAVIGTAASEVWLGIAGWTALVRYQRRDDAASAALLETSAP